MYEGSPHTKHSEAVDGSSYQISGIFVCYLEFYGKFAWHLSFSDIPVKGRLSLGGQNKQTLKTLLSQGAYKRKHCRDLPCFALIVSEILQDLKLTEGFLCEMSRIKDEFQNEKIPTTLICLRGVTKTTKRAIIITKSCIYFIGFDKIKWILQTR